MPLERTGVELVAEGASSYLGLIGAAEDATNSFIKSLQALAAEGDNMQKAFSNISPAVRTTGTDLAETEKQSSNLFGTLVGANFVANIVTQAFNSITHSVTGFIQGAVGAVKEIQNLEITLESLIAREYVQAGAADNVSDALKLVGNAADDVMLKIKDISVISPFEYKQIVSTFTMSMQFGQTSEAALELTQAITDLAAVNKGIPGVLQRVTYNFSQMAMLNRITTRDVKDLRMAGLDMAKVFEEELGMSIKEVDDALQSGKMQFDEVNKAFVEFSKRNYGGAAAKAATTLDGLISTFNDIMFFLSADIFKPVIDRLTVAANEILGVFQGVIDSGIFKWVGAAMDVAAEAAINLVKSLIPLKQTFEVIDNGGQDIITHTFDPLKFELMRFGQEALQWAEKAFSWGLNLVSQFASGIIEGAAATLGAAMDFVSGILSFFLGPGSPPRVAPEVDAWGTSTMTEFLKGFQEADFSILDSIEGSLKNVFATIYDDSRESAKAIAGFSKELASIMAAGGQTPEDFYSRLTESAGEYGGELSELVRLQIELAGSAKQAEENQKALAAAQEAFQSASDSASALIDEYNRLLESGADKETLKAKREQVKAALAQRKEAKKAYIETAKTAAEDEKAAEGLSEKVKLQQMLVEQLIEYAKLQKEAAKADKAAKAAAKSDKAAGGGRAGVPAVSMPDKEYKLPSFGGASEQAEAVFEDMKEKIKEKFGTLFAPLTAIYEGRIKPAFERIKLAWNTLTANISSVWKQYVVPVIEWFKKLIPQETIDNILRVVGQVIGFRTVIASLYAVITGVGAIITSILLPALAAINWPLVAVIAILTALKLAWDNNFLGMRDVLLGIWAAIQPVFASVYEWLKTNIPIALAAVAEFWNTTLKPALEGIYEWLKVNIPRAIDAVVEWWDTKFVPALKNAWQWVQDNLIPMFISIGNFLDTVWTLACTAAQGAWETLQEAIVKFWTETLTPFYENTLKPFIKDIGEALSPALETLAGWWGTVSTAVSNFWNNTLKPFYEETLKPLLQTTFDLTDVVKGVKDQFNEWNDALKKIKLPDWLTPGSPTPLELGIKGLLGIISKDGILGRLRELGESFGGIFESSEAFFKLISEQLGAAIESLAYRVGTILNSAMTKLSTTISTTLIAAFSALSTELSTNTAPALLSMATSLSSAATNSGTLSNSWASMKNSAESLSTSIAGVTLALDSMISNIQTSYNAILAAHTVILVRMQNAWGTIAENIKDAAEYLKWYIELLKQLPPGVSAPASIEPDFATAATSLTSNPIATPARSFATAAAGQPVQNVTYQYVLNASVPTPIATVEHGFKILQVMGGAG